MCWRTPSKNDRVKKPVMMGKEASWKFIEVSQWVQSPPTQSLARRVVGNSACRAAMACTEPEGTSALAA